MLAISLFIQFCIVKEREEFAKAQIFDSPINYETITKLRRSSHHLVRTVERNLRWSDTFWDICAWSQSPPSSACQWFPFECSRSGSVEIVKDRPKLSSIPAIAVIPIAGRDRLRACSPYSGLIMVSIAWTSDSLKQSGWSVRCYRSHPLCNACIAHT